MHLEPVGTLVDPSLIDHGLLAGLADDDHLQYLLLAGRAGGQDANGGTVAGNVLELTGADAAPDTGIVRIHSPVNLAYDTFSNTTPAQQFCMQWNPTFTASGIYVGGCLQVAPVVTITTATFIPATFSDTSNMITAANPGFSAFTFINELAVIRNSGNFNLMNGLIMNIGLTHERNSSGTSTVALMGGISFSPQSRATVSGAVITKTSQVAVRVSPTFSTVAGSTANLGIIIGLQMNNPAAALFQPGAGAESATAIYGMVMNAMPFGGNITKAAVLCGLAAASNSYMLLNTGTAQSDFGAGSAHWDDNAGTYFGGTSIATADVVTYWNAVNSAYRIQFTLNTTSMLMSTPGSGRILVDCSIADNEFNFNCNRFSLGAQTGAVGNQVGVFVAGTRATGLAGEWSDFLLTQAGNITLNHAMGLVAGWTINAPSITLGGGGSVTTAAGLNIGGNPGSATNRIGLRIISNPTGGGGVNAALWITAGRAQFDGFIDINKPIALGGGAPATLGTIGGGGPTAAAQAQWVEIEVAGVRHWIPAWT